jgi:hypothetical protein
MLWRCYPKLLQQMQNTITLRVSIPRGKENQDRNYLSSDVFSFLCLLWFLKRQWTFTVYCAHAQWVLQVAVAFELFQPKPWAYPILGQPSNYLCSNTSKWWTWTIHMDLNSNSRCENFQECYMQCMPRVFLSSHAPSCAPFNFWISSEVWLEYFGQQWRGI